MEAIRFRFLNTLILLLAGFFVSVALHAQSTVGSGSIQGTITDPSGAVVPGADVTIRNTNTAQTIAAKTTDKGLYTAGSLQPGQYTIEVAQPGFGQQRLSVTVQVGVTSNGDVKLKLGNASETVNVTASQIAVDTTQSVVQGVMTTEQIESLPVDGRNFLNLAQLEPGVQLQDGQTFDPTKAGYSSVSFNGVNGRTARIELDGVDVSDETVGTTTLNISSGSIEEFQVSRSSLDASSELTSSGSINVSTRSGTNKFHGEAFGLFRDRRAGFANSPGGLDNPFQRDQFGGSIGGPILADKLFFFANVERVKQDQLQPQTFPAPFTALNGGFTSPFRDTYSVAKLDYQAPHGIHAFYRFAFENNLAAANFGFGYSVFNNRDNTPAHAAGVDFTTGSFTHSIRFQYLKFHNLIGGGTSVDANPHNPIPGANLDVADVGVQTGPNLLAPQQTYQADHQIKYDGSKTIRSHVLRYGFSFNHLLGGGFASFFGLGPQIQTLSSLAPSPNDGNIVDYPITAVIIGNGQGFFTEVPGFGAPAGGQKDNRLSLYVGDYWKVRPNFTLNYALRYQRDTGRNDSDLAPIPCSEVNPAFGNLSPCSGSALIFDSFSPGLGKKVRQPNSNFGPQVGFAWNVSGNGKTVIRAGAGIYYENSVFNNTLFDRPGKLAKGLFPNQAVICGGTNQIAFPNSDGTSTILTSFNGQSIADICNGTIGQSAPALIALQKAYQSAVAAAGPSSNGSFVGNILSVPAAFGLSNYSPNYRSPRSYQMNIGVQQSLWKDGVFTADYIRNIGLFIPRALDVNHVGAARFLNKTAALSAISATTTAFNCGGGTDSAAIDCAIGNGAQIGDFAGNGLDSGVTAFSGLPASVVGLTPDTGAAFPGANPLVGQGLFQYYGGRSVYSGLQLNFRQQYSRTRFLRGGNFEVSYALSRFEGSGGNDQNFSAVAVDNDNPNHFYGPTNLDRTHQLSFGGVFDPQIASWKSGPRFSIISHFYSAPASTLRVSDSGPGQIFRTDYTGDGTAQDLLPGTNVGALDRTVSPGGLNRAIANYNTNVGGKPTPAGQALINAGLFSATQLSQLGAVAPILAPALPGVQGNGGTRTFDFRLSYPFSIERSSFQLHIEPSIGFFNIFNFSNFVDYSAGTSTAPGQSDLGTTASPGTLQGTTNGPSRDYLRIGNGTGTFAQGAPRELEYGLKITF
jgi:hypothetical protein